MEKKICHPNPDRKLAEDHVRWYMAQLRYQFGAWADITEKLMVENFLHGIKHGRESEHETGVAPGPKPGPNAGADENS